MLLALGECFAHDSVGFLDEGRFQRLLPPLAEQLHGAPPPGAAPALAALLPPELAAPPADSAAAAAAVPDAAADPYGAAAVAALTRLAAAAGSDVMYRPLNRAVRTMCMLRGSLESIPPSMAVHEYSLPGQAELRCLACGHRVSSCWGHAES